MIYFRLKLLFLVCSLTAAQKIAVIQTSDPRFTKNHWEHPVHPLESSVYFTALSAYLYCQKHGYRYLRVQDTLQTNAAHHWLKPRGLNYTLALDDNFDYVVMLDADVVIMQPDVPITDMFKKWGFDNPAQIVAAPDETDMPNSWMVYNGRRFKQVNTGFMVWRNGQRAREAARAWSTCFDNSSSPCFQFRNRWAFDMGGFNTFIRHDLLRPEELVVIPCGDANGFPSELTGKNNHGCGGKFASHFWEDSKAIFHVKLNRNLFVEMAVQTWDQLQKSGSIREIK